MEEQKNICKWIGEGEKCRDIPIEGKSYCKRHYERMFDVYFSEMADYVIEKELKST